MWLSVAIEAHEKGMLKEILIAVATYGDEWPHAYADVFEHLVRRFKASVARWVSVWWLEDEHASKLLRGVTEYGEGLDRDYENNYNVRICLLFGEHRYESRYMRC